MRIRTVKPEFWTSQDVADLPDDFTRLHYIGLWNFADDSGRGRDDVRLIRAALYPLRDDVSPRVVDDAMWSLAEHGQIRRYEVGGKRFYEVVEWTHQRINRPTESKLPGSDEGTLREQEALTEPVTPGDNCEHEGSRQEVEQGTGSRNREQGTSAPLGAAQEEPFERTPNQILAEILLDASSRAQYLLAQIVAEDDRWDAISSGALMRLGGKYGPSAVLTALAFVSEGEASPIDPYPYLESICVRIQTERAEAS